MLLRDWEAAPDARFAARIQAVLALGETKRNGSAKVRSACHGLRSGIWGHLNSFIHCDLRLPAWLQITLASDLCSIPREIFNFRHEKKFKRTPSLRALPWRGQNCVAAFIGAAQPGDPSAFSPRVSNRDCHRFIPAAQAWQRLSRAVHACPWDVSQRVALAFAALRSGATRAPAAGRLCRDSRLDRLAPCGGSARDARREAVRRQPPSQVWLD